MVLDLSRQFQLAGFEINVVTDADAQRFVDCLRHEIVQIENSVRDLKVLKFHCSLKNEYRSKEQTIADALQRINSEKQSKEEIKRLKRKMKA